MNMWSAAGLVCLVVLAHGMTTTANAVGEQPECELYQLPACTRELDQVCGTDGETYGNECMLCLAISEDHKTDLLIQHKGTC